MAWSKEQIDEVYAKVQQKAMVDAAFREELLRDAGPAISKVAGEPLPEEFKIKVIENDPGYTATFVLPDMTAGELSEDELNQVAGGLCGVDGACAANVCLAKDK